LGAPRATPMSRSTAIGATSSNRSTHGQNRFIFAPLSISLASRGPAMRRLICQPP
jgi:hypothetical protein